MALVLRSNSASPDDVNPAVLILLAVFVAAIVVAMILAVIATIAKSIGRGLNWVPQSHSSAKL